MVDLLSNEQSYQKHVKLYSSLPEFESKHAAITANSKESHSENGKMKIA